VFQLFRFQLCSYFLIPNSYFSFATGVPGEMLTNKDTAKAECVMNSMMEDKFDIANLKKTAEYR